MLGLAFALAAPPRASAQADRETVFWQSIQNSRDPAEFQEYLRRFPDGIYAGLARIRLAGLKPQPEPPSPPAPMAVPAQRSEAPPVPEPLTLMRPGLSDTALLTSGAAKVALFGVVGVQGSAVEEVRGYLAANGDLLTCIPQSATEHACLLADGTDLAAAELRNGAALARADARTVYRDMEALARDERRGVWAALPPAPVTLRGPAVSDTATLSAGGRTVRLAGVVGLGGRPASELRAHVAANGDALVCSPQGGRESFVCMLGDGTDLAKLVLVNGAARAAPGAPEAYRAEQAAAVANGRGIWRKPPPEPAGAAPPVPGFAPAPGDDGQDGVTYLGEAPTIKVDGVAVFLAFAGPAGWGYWDRAARWHRAPAVVHEHMERFHPAGAGLGAYRSPQPAPGCFGQRC